MNYQLPSQQPESEPLCDPGRPAGVVNLISWALGLLVIWGILLLGAWKLLSPLYQENAGPQPPQAQAVSSAETNPVGH